MFFLLIFPLLFPWDGCIMVYHGVHLLCLSVELNDLTTIFVASTVGLFVFVWLPYSVLLGIFLEYFTLLCIVPGEMHQAYFVTSRLIARMACIIFLELASTALPGVGWIGIFSSLTFPATVGTFGICSSGGFRRCYSFVYLLCNLHVFEHLICFLVGLPFKVPALYIVLLFPYVRNSMEDDLVYLFVGNLLGGP